MKPALTTLNEVGDSQRLTKSKSSKTNNPLGAIPEDVEELHPRFLPWLEDTWTLDTDCLQVGGGGGGGGVSVWKEQVRIAKWGDNRIISSFTTTRANLLPSSTLDSCRRRDEVCWVRATLSLSSSPKLLVLKREREGGPSYCNTPEVNNLTLSVFQTEGTRVCLQKVLSEMTLAV